MASYVTFASGGDDFFPSSNWVPGQHQPCLFEDDHSAILDERHIELVAGNPYHDTFAIPSGLETSAPSPGTDSTLHDWSHAPALGGLDGMICLFTPANASPY